MQYTLNVESIKVSVRICDRNYFKQARERHDQSQH